ncbi:MAG: hypothetical protein QOE49_5731, partial [Rhodospirillaceae bacterium]|nr:hypothetical protein [Rhodospirillaceae bacterium]
MHAILSRPIQPFAASRILAPDRIYPARTDVGRIAWFDMALICLFLLGLYSNYTIAISAKVPFPSAPAGIAGIILLWRRRDRISAAAFAGLICV